ncbi:MAG: universal stress protein [Acidobacteriota bacterium]
MFRTILAPVDFSDHSERSARFALEVAAMTGGHVTLVTVVDGLLDAAAQASGASDSLTTQTEQEYQRLIGRLGAERALAEGRVTLAVAVGKAAEEIVKQAHERQADLIVMGTHGLGAAERLVLGSTTARVLREAQVPVLAVPSSLE